MKLLIEAEGRGVSVCCASIPHPAESAVTTASIAHRASLASRGPVRWHRQGKHQPTGGRCGELLLMDSGSAETMATAGFGFAPRATLAPPRFTVYGPDD